MNKLLEIANKYYLAGLSVIPIGADKVPIGSWKDSQSVLYKPEWNSNFTSIGLVCGFVSGNIEVIDIDCKYDITGNLYRDYCKIIADNDPNLLGKLLIQETANKGYHFVYKCEKVEGNLKLARRESTLEESAIKKEKFKALIETRGQGGYIVMAPSPGYRIIQGSFDNVVTISVLERDLLFECAKVLNQEFDIHIEIPKTKIAYVPTEGEVSPLDDFSARGEIEQYLIEAGWTYIGKVGENLMFLRPGGEKKWSAGWHPGKRLFRNFSQSTEFEADKSYNASQVLSFVKFNKNYSECAKWLLKNGFGKKGITKQILPVKTIEHKNEFSFLADPKDINTYLQQWINGTFVKGITTGIYSLDKFFVLKRGNFNIINGKDNVGKSVFMWYLLLLSALFHGWKWIVYSNENKAGTVVKRMIEFYWGQKIDKISKSQFEEAKFFVDEHFAIISNDNILTYKDVLNFCTKMLLIKKFDGALVDPYNSLKIDLSETSKLSTHEYHYEAASEMQVFTKKNDFCIYLNCHVVTFAARQEAAPNKADTEGGGKFPNKADDFITLHRKPNSNEWRNMEIYTRKIKETETGGSYTMEDRPFILKMLEGNCGYEDEQGVNPVAEYWRKKNNIHHSYSSAIENFHEPNKEYTEMPF